jgi:peptide/nickel transport system substrate-binding protein
MMIESLDRLVAELRAGVVSRRAFLRRATAAGMSAAAASMIARNVAAQGATPEASPVASPEASPVASPAASGEVKRSMSREEYQAQILAHFPFEDPASKGGQVIYPSLVEIATLNPHIRSDIAALYIIAPMFSSLISSAPWDSSIFGPDLADYWEESADGLTFTFYLNRNARFHDGMPVTAADVVFSYDAMISPDGLAVYQSDFAANVKSYRAIDGYTFELVAKQRSALFLSAACAGLFVLPKHIWEPIPYLDWGSAPGATGADPAQVIGSGPFRFQEWVKNDHVTIVRNDDYFIPELVPSVDSFTLRVIPESAAAIQSLLTGETDIASVPPAQVESIRTSNPDMVIHEYDTWQHVFFAPNLGPQGTLFKDLKTRQALYHALDRDLIVEQILLGFGVRADGPQPPPSPAYAPDRIATIYGYDPDRARALLEEAGWIDVDGDGIRERDGVKFACELNYVDNQTNAQIVTYAQQVFGEIGLSVSPVAEPQPTFIDRLFAGNFQLSLLGVTWINMGDQGAIHSCAGVPPNGFNISQWCNAEYDALQAQQLVELDPARRVEMLIEMSNIFNDDAGDIIMYFTKAIAAQQPRLKNSFPNGYGLLWSLGWMWIDPEA